jgi:hypothetical protein
MTFSNKEFKDTDKGKKSFDIPPAGAEVVLVVRKDGTEERVSKTTGNKYQQVKMETISDVGRGYFFYYTIPEGEYQMSFLGRMLEAMGFDLKKVKAVDFNKLVGKRCRAKVKHELRGGESRASINYFLPYNAQIEAVTADAAASVKDDNAGDDVGESNDEPPMPF